MFGHLVRFCVLMLGYVLGAFAASLMLNLLVFSVFHHQPDGSGLTLGSGRLIGVLPLAIVISYFAFLPAALVIVLTEILGLRDWLWHALGGGVVAVSVAGFSAWDARNAAAPADTGLFMAVVAAGLVGGLAYWLVAGSSAGVSIRPGSRNGSTSPERSGS